MGVMLQRDDVRNGVLAMYPHCPQRDRREIIRHVMSHLWPEGTDAVSAVRFSARAHVRHRLLAYGSLMAETGIGRSEARRVIGPIVAKVIASWEPA